MGLQNHIAPLPPALAGWKCKWFKSPRYDDATADAQFIVLKEPGLRVDTMAASGTEAACAFWDDVRVSCRTKVECQAQVGGVQVYYW